MKTRLVAVIGVFGILGICLAEEGTNQTMRVSAMVNGLSETAESGITKSEEVILPSMWPTEGDERTISERTLDLSRSDQSWLERFMENTYFDTAFSPDKVARDKFCWYIPIEGRSFEIGVDILSTYPNGDVFHPGKEFYEACVELHIPLK